MAPRSAYRYVKPISVQPVISNEPAQAFRDAIEHVWEMWIVDLKEVAAREAMGEQDTKTLRKRILFFTNILGFDDPKVAISDLNREINVSRELHDNEHEIALTVCEGRLSQLEANEPHDEKLLVDSLKSWVASLKKR